MRISMLNTGAGQSCLGGERVMGFAAASTTRYQLGQRAVVPTLITTGSD
ncbi:hypothetical protein HMPREF3223_00814 [Cutibacterium avidum]|nr:hypothetical protein HMPREF3223_00814 [Cutibacterium avidum]